MGGGGQCPAHIPGGNPLPGLTGRCAKTSPGPGSLPVLLSSSYTHGLAPHPPWALNPTGLGDHGTVWLSARFSYCQAGQVAQQLRDQEETIQPPHLHPHQGPLPVANSQPPGRWLCSAKELERQTDRLQPGGKERP